MTGAEALALIRKYGPCHHDSADTSLGDGRTLACCNYCGTKFYQKHWQDARDAAQKFDEAVALLNSLICSADCCREDLEVVRRKIFVCIHCDMIYPDQPVTQCDCLDGTGHDFVEGVAEYQKPTATA